MRVRIDKHNDSMMNRRQRTLQRACFPAVFLTQQTHAWIDIGHALNFGGGLIARTIVDYNDFELAFVIR